MNNTNYVKKLSFFSELDDESLDKVAKIMIEKRYKKDMIIFMENQPAEAVFFVKKGKVKIYKTAEDGKEHIIHIMSNGDVFAEACLFSDQNYPANSQAIEDTEIIMIKNKDLENILQLYPDIAIQIIKVLAARLRMVSMQIENLALKDAYGKTASLIMMLLKRQGIALKNGARIKTNLSRQDMANMIGLTRETFTRALFKLKQEKVIDVNKDEIVILDFNRLEKWSN